MAQRSPAEADRYIEEAEELGIVTDSALRSMRSIVAEHRTTAHARAFNAAQVDYDAAHRIGSEVRDEFDAIAPEADQIAKAIETGHLAPDDGRRALDRLLARHAAASSRAKTFAASADRCVEIDADPEAWAEAFYAAHPIVRPEMGF